MTSVVFRKHWFRVSKTIPISCLQALTMEATRNILGDLVVTLNGYALGEDKSIRSGTVSFPATWWDAVKERFAPKWFRQKHPVQYTTYELTAEAVYPNLKLQIPTETAVIYITKRKVDDEN